MSLKRLLCSTVAAVGTAAFAAGLPMQVSAQQVGATDLGGVVTGPGGPEAGVWVIAETTDLPTKFTKIVVTDDRGRYLIPELPKAQIQNVGARLRPGRFAQGAERRRARPSISQRCRRRTRPRRSTTRRSTGIRMLKVPAKSEFPARAR